MKRHVSQVKGNKQNAGTVPHLCLHMICSLAHACLTATDPYQPSDFLAIISVFPSCCCLTSRGIYVHLVHCSVRCCGTFAYFLWYFPSIYSTASMGNALTHPPHFMQCQEQVIQIFISCLQLLQCFSKQLFAAHSRSSSNATIGEFLCGNQILHC